MVPAITTYGKKGLLKTWGSRRRQRHFPPGAQNSEPRAASSEPLKDKSSKEVLLPDDSEHRDSIDKIASALLDDSDPLPGQDDNAEFDTASDASPQVRHRSRPILSHGQPPRNTDGAILSPFTMHPVFASPQDTTSKNDHSAQETERNRHTAPRSKLVHSSSVQPSVGSLKPRRAHRLERRRPRSQMSPADYLEQDDGDEGFGGLAPRPGPEEASRASQTSQRGSPVSPLAPTAEEINEKVMAMLAATEALKPRAAPSRASTTPKLSQMVPARVLTKVSNAWDRFHHKPSTPEHRARRKLRKRSVPGGLARAGLVEANQTRPGDGGPPLTLSSKVRSHEDKSSAKRKAQEGPGSPAPRKPVAVSCSRLRVDQLADVFLDGAHRPPTPSSSQNQQASESEGSANNSTRASPVVVENPFETETGFEHNLEDRILSTEPVGCSTPRSRSFAGSAVHSSDNSGTDNASSDVQVDLARLVVKTGDGGARRGPARQVTLMPSESRRAIEQAGPCRQQPTMLRNRVSHLQGHERVKKHPSPSKRDLEELELALQRNEPGLRPLLAVKDENRLMGRRLGDGDPLAQLSPCSTRKSRGPRRFNNSLKPRQRVRLAAAIRPATARPDDFDELL
ncbi:hypothetical protein CDD83_737 [Cordyceps sp. RAO-2017]|nr:hypothetical protein CDD83_737 [Cordyceps sp. RAO-2017]